MYDPGADAAERYPDWVVRTRDLMQVPEVLCWERQVILVNQALSKTERRCALAHAIAHLDLEHRAVFGERFEAREEAEADELAAERLLDDVTVIANAAYSAMSFAELAADLNVTPRILRIRWASLRPQDRMRLERRLAAMEQIA